MRIARHPVLRQPSQHPVQRDRGPVFVGSGTTIDCGPRRRQPFEHPEQMIRRDAEHRRAEAAHRVERHDGARRRDLAREPVHEMDLRADGPDRSFRTVLDRADDVFGRAASRRRPARRRTCTSGWTMTLPPGCCVRNCSICFTLNRVWTLQCPFQRISCAARGPRGSTPPNGWSGSHTPSRSSGTPILIGGVPAEMLIGQHQDLLAALPRPAHHLRRGVARRADDAAVLAAEAFDGRGRVDVGDRNRRSSTPSCAQLAASTISS